MQAFRGQPAVILLSMFLLNIDGWAYLSELTPIQPVLWLAPLALLTAPHWRRVPSLAESPLLRLQFFLFAFALLGAVRDSNSESKLQDIYVQGSAMVFTALCLAQFRRPEVIPRFLRMVPYLLVLAVTLCVMDLFIPNSFSRTLGRGSGFYVNPNLAASVMTGMLVAVVSCSSSMRRVYRSIALTTAGVLTTFSRGGFLTLIAVGLRYWLSRGSSSFLGKSLGLAFAIVLWFVFVNLLSDDLIRNQNIAARLEIFRGGGEQIADISSDARIRVIPTALREFMDAPLVGQGMQVADSLPLEVERIGMHQLGPHNEFLWMLLTYGLLGFFALLHYLYSISRGGNKFLVTFLLMQCLLVDGIFLIREMIILFAFIEQARRAQLANGESALRPQGAR